MDDKILVSVVSLMVSIATFFIGRASAHRQEGRESGYLASDIGYVKAGIDDLKTEIRSIKLEMAEFSTRLTRLEERVSYAHERIDAIEKAKEGG